MQTQTDNCQRCLFCGHTANMVYVHGHYQCPVCNTNALPCCDGDNCGNNFLTTAEKGGFIQVNNTAFTSGTQANSC